MIALNKRSTGFLFIILAIVLAGILTMTVKTTTIHAAPSISGLHVSGNQLVNGNGQSIRMLGVNHSGSEYQCVNGSGTIFEGPSDSASVDAMLTWDINTVRVPLNEDCWLGINGVDAAVSGSNYQQAIVNYVNLLNSKGIIAIVELHWAAPGTNLSNGQIPMPDLDHAVDFWKSVATTFKDNSDAVLEIYNEPHDDYGGGACWRDGSNGTYAPPCTGTWYAAAGMQTLVDAVRGQGNNNIIMLNGWGWGNWIGDWLTYEPTDPQHNLMADMHIYQNSGCNTDSCYDSSVTPVANAVPVIFGEIGESDCGHSFIDDIMNWADQHGISYLGWAWNVQDCGKFPALITDWNGTPTAFGQGLHDHLIALAGGSVPTPTPTPNPTSTPTPNPTSTPTPTPTPNPGGTSCQITYTVDSQWNGAFNASLNITNTGSTDINGWTLTFDFTAGQQISQIWNAGYSQQGGTVQITNASNDASIPAGQALTSVGFGATWNGSNPNPTSFTLNGTACSVS